MFPVVGKKKTRKSHETSSVWSFSAGKVEMNVLILTLFTCSFPVRRIRILTVNEMLNICPSPLPLKQMLVSWRFHHSIRVRSRSAL